MAEGEGFEPPDPVRSLSLSRRARLTTLPTFRITKFWKRGPDSNRRLSALQAVACPLCHLVYDPITINVIYIGVKNL